MEVVGGIYSPNHNSSRCCRWHIGQSGGAPDRELFIFLVPAMSADRWGLERLTVEVFCPLAAPDSPVAHRIVQCVLTSLL
jgi:hypothetical protein